VTLWVILTVSCLAALGFIIWPLYRQSRQLTSLLAGAIVFIVALSAGLYYVIGNPGVSSGVGSMPNVEEMVESLEQRLQSSPDDVDGWRMLGRSYQTMQRYDDAIAAFEKTIELERGQNANTLVALAIVIMEQHDGAMSLRSSSLIEDALALDPINANALFYGGASAARKGDTALAADRWETLLGLNAPADIQDLLRAKINEWRGLPPPTVKQNIAGISIELSVSDEAAAKLPADATLFVIARDPAQPSPPIAVAPRKLSELPTVVSLSDQNAMMPGRLLSAYAEVEIVARVTLSGQPIAQAGDWFGSKIVNLADTDTISLVIDQEVP